MNAGKLQLISKQNVDPLHEELNQLRARNEMMQAELERLRLENAAEDALGHVDEDKPAQVPCVVELLVDNSLNKPQMKIDGEAGLKLGVLAADCESIVELLRNDEGIVVAKCLKSELAINGRILETDENSFEELVVELAHGDRLALDGARFFVFVADEHASLNSLVTYHQAKLEYVEKSFP